MNTIPAPGRHELVEIRRAIGERIRETRELACISQKTLADYVGISSGELTTIEAGRDDCPVWALTRIATCCAVSVDCLLRRTVDDRPVAVELERRTREHLVMMELRNEQFREQEVMKRLLLEGRQNKLEAVLIPVAEASAGVSYALTRFIDRNAKEWEDMPNGNSLLQAVMRCANAAEMAERQAIKLGVDIESLKKSENVE